MTTSTETPTEASAPTLHLLHGGATLTRMLSNALVAAGRDDTLPMLCGVKVEHDGEKLTIVATDRYRMVFESNDLSLGDGHGPVAPFELFLPLSGAKFAVRWLRGQGAAPIRVTVKAEPVGIRFESPESAVEVRAVEQSGFPSWRPIAKAPEGSESVNSIGFTPQFLADVGKLKSAFGRSGHLVMKVAGPRKPVHIELPDGPTMILMPVRLDDGERL